MFNTPYTITFIGVFKETIWVEVSPFKAHSIGNGIIGPGLHLTSFLVAFLTKT